MLPKIVLLHDAQAAEGRPDASDTLVEARAIAAELAALGYATITLPVVVVPIFFIFGPTL